MDMRKGRFMHLLYNFSHEPRTFEYIAGFVAFMLHFPSHVALVSSRHLAVAFKIPEDTTGIYFTKLSCIRGFVLLFGSLLIYIIKWFISENNIIIAILCSSLLFIARFCMFIIFFISKNLALDFYNVFIFESLCLGLFQMTFYTLTPEYSSLLSLCVKLSKISIFLFQLIMDFSIYDDPLQMAKIHYCIIFTLTAFSNILWVFYCNFKYKLINTETTNTETLEIGEEKHKVPYFKLLKRSVVPVHVDALGGPEPTFLEHLKKCISPSLMCNVTLIMNNMITPGLMPYALLERDKCHKINMAITPMALSGYILIHTLKKNVKSIDRKWEWYWHLFWLFAIPPFIIFIITFTVLHTNGNLSKSIIGSEKTVLFMALLFFFCHPAIETLGFVGVVSNVKHMGVVLNNGLKVIATNQFISYVVGFITYKISVGYNVTRSLKDLYPPNDAGFGKKLWYWISSSFQRGFTDFINEFRMNIKEYI